MGGILSRRNIAVAVFILAYSLWFAWPGLSARFAPDDMMNMAGYWEKGLPALLLAQFDFTAYRPMGGLFYLLLFQAAGLNPLPYRVAILLILILNTYLICRFAGRLSGSGLVGALSALAVSYHAGLCVIWYETAVIYDILCFTFYFAAFNWYLGRRSRNAGLRLRDTGAILALYVCALNSKEMAVTLPVALCLYEWIYHRPDGWRWPALAGWLRVHAPVTAGAAAITLPYIYAKMYGPGSLTALDIYRPEFTLARFLASSRRQLGAILYQGDRLGPWALAAIWSSLLILAWWKRDRLLGFAWAFIMLTPLPAVFLPGRAGASLYIPLAGWAVLTSAIVAGLSEKLAAFLSRRYPAWPARAVVVSCWVLLLGWTAARRQPSLLRDLAASQDQTWAVIQQLRSLDPKVKPGSTVVFLDDPFAEWDTYLIARLWFRDRTLTVRLQKKTPLPDDEIATTDYIFRFEGTRLVQVKPPR
jgi:hypothetical protein